MATKVHLDRNLEDCNTALVKQFYDAIVAVRDLKETVTVSGITLSPGESWPWKGRSRIPRTAYDFWEATISTCCGEARGFGGLVLNKSRSGVLSTARTFAAEVEYREKAFAECVAHLQPVWDRWEQDAQNAIAA